MAYRGQTTPVWTAAVTPTADLAGRDEGAVIIYAGSLRVDPTDRAGFIAARLDQVRSARAESGCLSYAISPDPVEPDLVQVFECYEDEAALAAHVAVHNRDHAITVRAMEVFRYDVSHREQLVLAPPEH
jgi:quinol monooxygenase YgiN